MGLGDTLSEELHFRGGDLRNRNADVHVIPRFAGMPPSAGDAQVAGQSVLARPPVVGMTSGTPAGGLAARSGGPCRTLVVLAVALVWLGCTAWARPLFLPDEGRYVGVAWEMLRSGNWLTPTLDGLPYFHKPPLFYWLVATSMRLLGAAEWAARLVSVTAATLTVTALWRFLREWVDTRTAQLAAVVLATQPLFFVGAQFANLDMLVAACITLAVLLAAEAVWRREAGRPWRAVLAGAYLAMAAGVLAKGLIGLVLPMLVIGLWLASGRCWRALAGLLWWPGIVLSAGVMLPWFVAEQQRFPGFLHYFVVVQHLRRFAGSGFNGVQPVWFYVPVLLLFGLPWTAWLIGALRRPASFPAPQRPDLPRLMRVWIAVVVIFFSLPQSKLIGYILPALPPLAVLIAGRARPWLDRPARRYRVLATAALSATLCLGVVGFFALNHPKSSRELARSIASMRLPGEGLAFVDGYVYDLPFYLRQVGPVFVVADDWRPAAVAQHDDWRRELADAGNFVDAAARARLLDPYGLREALCAGQVAWVIAPLDTASRQPMLAATAPVFAAGKRAAWHLDATRSATRAALKCGDPAG